MQTDVELLLRWRDGDSRAGNDLLHRHFAAVFRYFDVNVRGAEVDDLTQRTFEACARSQERIRDPENFRGYLLGIARNVLYKHVRAKYPRPDEVPLSGHQLVGTDTSPSSFIAREDQRRAFLCAVGHLPEVFQRSVVLFYWHDLGVEEIARQLGVSPGTIKSRLNRARGLLRDAIARYAADGVLAESTMSCLDAKAIDGA